MRKQELVVAFHGKEMVKYQFGPKAEVKYQFGPKADSLWVTVCVDVAELERSSGYKPLRDR